MRIITDTIRAEGEFSAVLAAAREQRAAASPLPLLVNGLSGGAQLAFCAELARESAASGHPTLLLLPQDGAVHRVAEQLSVAGLRALPYPARDFVLHPMIASHGMERERLFVLHSLLRGEAEVIVTTPAAAVQATMPRTHLAELALTLQAGQEIAPGDLADGLLAMGYARVEAVDGIGQYARRGDILDVFASGDAFPVRLEFFGDEIERISRFDPLTQRRFEECAHLLLLPARELLPDEEAKARIKKAILTLDKKASEAGKKTLASELSSLDGGLALPTLDKYIGQVYAAPDCLFDYLLDRPRPTVLMLDTAAARDNLTATHTLMGESVMPLLSEGVFVPANAELFYRSEAWLDGALSACVTVHLNAFSGVRGVRKSAGLFGFRCRTGVSYFDRTDLLCEDARTFAEGGYRILLVTSSTGEESALAERLAGAGLATRSVPPDTPALEALQHTGIIYTTVLSDFSGEFSGFDLPAARVAVLSALPDEGKLRREARRDRRRKKKAAGERLLSYADLREGDLVVHAVHGIGRFEGMTTMTVDGATRDYITIRYAGTDKLFLPADRLEMISKYIGAGGAEDSVRLSRMGGAEWGRATGKAKAAARDMARELINLYAARARRPGHAFSPDDAMQREFEAAFPFEETDGQLAAAEEIKRDMESPVPMDRLLCGDVGYGKTEVALRAAFKAVADGKQVAMLVPTTVLAMQHYETVLARMRAFPVTVEMLSRFRTKKQTDAILRRLRRGEIDILIGTHKLLSSKIEFRDLGLLVVDEEQRFGVAQKEKLKELAGNVDVLTLTATPIPRTLNMAMNGIRDMSLLDEAPADRHPVETYVMEHDDAVIAEAIRRELRRGGQVIYLYNRVETMDRVLARLSRDLPDARIASAHGKTDREELEDIWQALWHGELDVILCTTIVETGVDLPNANTLIIEDADRLGLAQLHQIRGRVGRSGRQAYAYLTYRTGKILTEVAARRLSAIREYAAFGAGFKIALRDLEIRGAGNLLGAEQHGHIEAVGYELYVRLLSEAVLEEQGKAPAPHFEATVDIRASAYIPEHYVASEAARMELYKKISAITEEADMADILEECADRYGRVPRELIRLLWVALSRALACRHRIRRVEGRGDSIRLVLTEVDLAGWSVVFADRGNLKFEKTAPPAVVARLGAGEEPCEAAAKLLLAYHAATKTEEKKEETA
ncbi:MAG: transcription-repair coupling factor [Clostridia bacterium]|nr:transcription-repair coupling factor [Clostridia bacterium]